MQRQKKWCFLCLLFISLVGCSIVKNIDRRNKFEDRVRLYSQAIRWSDFEVAQGFIRMRVVHAQKQDLDFFNKIKVAKYKSTNKTPKQNFNDQTADIIDGQILDINDEENSDIILVYEIDYFIEDEYKMKQVRYEQLWWYDETEGNWFLDSDLPRFDQ